MSDTWPTPWYVSPYSDDECTAICSADGTMVAAISEPGHADVAHKLLRAVNNHDALLAACKLASEVLGGGVDMMVCRTLQAAIDAAEQEPTR